MNPVKLMDKAFYNLDAKEYAKVVNKTAQRSKNFAKRLVSEGIRGNVRDKDIIKTVNAELPGMYDNTTGKLTAKGIKEMLKNIRDMFSLNSDEAAKKITVRQAINKAVEDAEKSTIDRIA